MNGHYRSSRGRFRTHKEKKEEKKIKEKIGRHLEIIIAAINRHALMNPHTHTHTQPIDSFNYLQFIVMMAKDERLNERDEKTHVTDVYQVLFISVFVSSYRKHGPL